MIGSYLAVSLVLRLAKVCAGASLSSESLGRPRGRRGRASEVQEPTPQTSTQTDRAWQVVIGSRHDCVRGNNLEQLSPSTKLTGSLNLG